LTERCGNLVENKGPLWKKGDEAGISLIAKEIIAESGNVVEKKWDNRFLGFAFWSFCRCL
jgi:hypothetical protein